MIAANNLHDEKRAAIDESVEYDVATRSVSRARLPLYWALATSAISYGTLSCEISPLSCNATGTAARMGRRSNGRRPIRGGIIPSNDLYRASQTFVFGIGITPNLTARSVQGSWPYWAATDRQMAEEFFRGGFSSGFFLTGEPIKRLQYTLSMNNNISQLGVVQSNDIPTLAYSGNLRWQPPTGEFGTRNGLADFEFHTRAATQFGGSLMRSREGRGAPDTQPPNATQIRLSDGLNPFELGALADDAIVDRLTFQYACVDAGVKYQGNSTRRLGSSRSPTQDRD
jgi:hypothetical protein